jgi:hypothetical protein
MCCIDFYLSFGFGSKGIMMPSILTHEAGEHLICAASVKLGYF